MYQKPPAPIIPFPISLQRVFLFLVMIMKGCHGVHITAKQHMEGVK